MRGPRHFRQKHRHANALTLNLDLIGPWTAGDDHALAGPARHILVATLGVPILKDGKPLPLEKETEGEEKEREEGNEDDGGGVGPIGPEDGDDQLVLEDPESKEESEEGELSPEEYAALYERQEAKWREIAKELQEPVQVHEVLFAEPLQSKRSEEVLRGIQRIYSKITVMNLSVRRFHVAPVVYAGVRDPIKFVGEIDEEDCRSLCLQLFLSQRRQNLCLTARKLKRKEAGEQVEILPAKAIFQKKGADIRTAFLLAPLRQNQKRTVLRPPSVLVQAGFAAPGEYWEITGALYGLQTSPADWAIYRDETLPTLDVWCGDQKTHLRRSKHDPNLWLLYCPKTSRLIAALTIYVDDLLLSGTPEASQAVWEAIKAKWKISEPEYADQGVVTFCGFEIRQQPDGIHVGQAKYVQSLLDKYSEVTGTSSCPYARESEVIDAKPQESIEKLRRAQAVAGELLWLATRTRPDLAFGVSRIGQLITKDVDQALRRGEEMIKYLRTTKQQELIYGEPGLGHGAADQLPVARDFNLIEVFADASFCPGTDRSQSGIVLMWGNCPIGWMSMRQPCASLSTAEAELQSSLDGMTLAEGIYGLLEELAEAPQSAFLYNDNVGACTVMTLPQGSWRTRHLRLKAAWFMEQLERARFRVYHVPGQYMLGDLCTKSLQGVRVRELLQMMSVRLDPSKVDGGESASASTSTSTSSSTSSSNSSSSTGKPVVQKVVAGSGGASTRESTGSSGTGGASGAVRALRALTVANALRAVTSKLVHVSVDIDESQASEIAELKTTLQLVCCVLTIVGVLALACWCCENKESVPRIQALSSRVRDQDSEITDDGEWSMIEEQFTEALTSGREPEETTTGRTTRAGLRNRLGSRSLAASASDDPRGSRINSPEEEDRRWLGSGSSVPNIPSGSSSTPTPREGRRSHPGGGLLSSPSSLPGEGMLNASQPGREMSGLPQGVLHDDGASGADLAEGSPAGELDGLNEGTGRGELEHDLQEDANAEIVNVRRSRETERERLEIHPGWTLRLPPRFSWDPKPEWGSWESLFHQSIPKAVKRDFYYHDRVRSVLVRFHAQERRQLFVPSPGGLPESVSWANLTGRRRTFHRGVTTNPAGILEDEWNVPHPKPARQISTEKWIGRTEFELQDS
ncbi:RE1 [Symbiodinium sp. KB8]|nr:RE1 [Symbiodinium sp. KB8]